MDIVRELAAKYADNLEYSREILKNWPTVKVALEMRGWDARTIMDLKRDCTERVKRG